MTSHPTKLRTELEEAKRHLREVIETVRAEPTSEGMTEATDDQRPAQSKLNTLLGTTTVPQRPLGLVQRVGVPQRPTYDLIADRVLGPNVGQPSSFLDLSLIHI